jgi:hypothetical protein
MSGPPKRRNQKANKRKHEKTESGPRIQVTDEPRQQKRLKIDKQEKKLIVILENCPLETAQVRI